MRDRITKRRDQLARMAESAAVPERPIRGTYIIRPAVSVACAPSLQAIAAVPVAHHSVFAQEPIFEYDRSSHPFRQHLVKEPLEQASGWLDVPTKAGLGVEVDRAVLDKQRL